MLLHSVRELICALRVVQVSRMGRSWVVPRVVAPGSHPEGCEGAVTRAHCAGVGPPGTGHVHVHLHAHAHGSTGGRPRAHTVHPPICACIPCTHGSAHCVTIVLPLCYLCVTIVCGAGVATKASVISALPCRISSTDCCERASACHRTRWPAP